ncbi:MAG: hypothetical protein ACLR5S_04515 [Ruminococcus sp.]
MNLPLIRADSGKEVVVEIQPIYRATVDRTITFYEVSGIRCSGNCSGTTHCFC